MVGVCLVLPPRASHPLCSPLASYLSPAHHHPRRRRPPRPRHQSVVAGSVRSRCCAPTDRCCRTVTASQTLGHLPGLRPRIAGKARFALFFPSHLGLFFRRILISRHARAAPQPFAPPARSHISDPVNPSHTLPHKRQNRGPLRFCSIFLTAAHIAAPRPAFHAHLHKRTAASYVGAVNTPRTAAEPYYTDIMGRRQDVCIPTIATHRVALLTPLSVFFPPSHPRCPRYVRVHRFNIYIHDYCSKRGFRKTARELMQEAEIAADAAPPINARQGLLFE